MEPGTEPGIEAVFQPIYKDFVAAWLTHRHWDALLDRYIRPNEDLLRQFYNNFVAAGGAGAMEADYRAYWTERPDRIDELIRRLDGAPRSLDESIRHTATRVRTGLHSESPVDIVALIGFGTTNACQLIHQGRPTVVLALDAWGRTFIDSHLPWSDIPLWLSHELAHVIRYAEGQSGFSKFIVNGSLRYNEAIEGLPLVEFLVDEGLATAAARLFGGDGDDARALGFTNRQLQWCRANEAALWREIRPKLHEPLTMDGYSRWFSFGADDIPPRSGYFLGLRLVERRLQIDAEGALDSEKPKGTTGKKHRPGGSRSRRSTAEQVLARAIRSPAADFV